MDEKGSGDMNRVFRLDAVVPDDLTRGLRCGAIKLSNDDPFVLEEILHLSGFAYGNWRFTAKPQHFRKGEARRNDAEFPGLGFGDDLPAPADGSSSSSWSHARKQHESQ
jgi:hypothetical protein